MARIAYKKLFINRKTFLNQTIAFFQKIFRVQNDTISNYANSIRIYNSGWYQMKNVFFPIHNHRMTGICSPLVSNNNIYIFT